MTSTESLNLIIQELESKLKKQKKIQDALMKRVENSTNLSGNAFSIFENNFVLRERVEDRTKELKDINRQLVIEIEKREKTEKENKNLIDDLQKALKEVKELSGLLPICSYCKKVRKDDGYWQTIETYVEEHSTAEFSHSICKECMKEKFPETSERLKKKRGE